MMTVLILMGLRLRQAKFTISSFTISTRMIKKTCRQHNIIYPVPMEMTVLVLIHQGHLNTGTTALNEKKAK